VSKADQETVERPRKTFGPVVLVGLASAGAVAVAGGKAWVAGTSGSYSTAGEDAQAVASGLSTQGASESPLALALALVVLACWGVVLVTRGRFRRVVAVLALVASLGMMAATVEALWSLPPKLADAMQAVSGSDESTTSFTSWYFVALVAGVLCVATTLAAVRLVPTWPEMGSQYDAPTGAGGASGEATGEVPSDNIDIWKALDEGRDPTA
jgi:uncharacterized membrane protein (TIGR02234 family)